MVSSLQDLNFDKVFNAVQAEIACQSNPHNMQPPNDKNTSQHETNFTQRSRSVQEVEVAEEVAEVDELDKEEPSEVALTSALVTVANVRVTSTLTAGTA